MSNKNKKADTFLKYLYKMGIGGTVGDPTKPTFSWATGQPTQPTKMAGGYNTPIAYMPSKTSVAGKAYLDLIEAQKIYDGRSFPEVEVNASDFDENFQESKKTGKKYSDKTNKEKFQNEKTFIEDLAVETALDQVPYLNIPKALYSIKKGRPLTATSEFIKTYSNPIIDATINGLQTNPSGYDIASVEDKYVPELQFGKQKLTAIGKERLQNKSLPKLDKAYKELGVSKKEFVDFISQNMDLGRSYEQALGDFKKGIQYKKGIQNQLDQIATNEKYALGGIIQNNMRKKMGLGGFAPLFDIASNLLLDGTMQAVTGMVKSLKEPEPESRITKMNTGRVMANGGMIKREDGSYSKRGLWDNIRANKGSGKKPTKEMLEQERKINSEMAFGGMVDPSMYMQQMMYGSYGMGGQVPNQVPVEVEGGEQFEMPNGQQGQFQGPPHEQGGVPTELPQGTKVYSDRLKGENGKTMADRKEIRERNVAKLERLISKNPHDKLLKETLKRQQQVANSEEQGDMAMQEQANQQQQAQEQQMMQQQMMGQMMQNPEMMMALGGYVQQMANGSPGTCPPGQYWNGTECVEIPNSFSTPKTVDNLDNTGGLNPYQKRNGVWKKITLGNDDSQIPFTNTDTHVYDQYGYPKTRYNMVDGRRLSEEERINLAYDDLGVPETNPETISTLNKNSLTKEAPYYEGLTAMQPLMQLFNPLTNQNSNVTSAPDINNFDYGKGAINKGLSTLGNKMKGLGQNKNIIPNVNNTLPLPPTYSESPRGLNVPNLNVPIGNMEGGFNKNKINDWYDKADAVSKTDLTQNNTPFFSEEQLNQFATPQFNPLDARKYQGVNSTGSNVDPNVYPEGMQLVEESKSLPIERYGDQDFTLMEGIQDNQSVTGTNPYEVMTNGLGKIFQNISQSKDPYINTKNGMIPNPLYNEVIGNKMLKEEDPKKPNKLMNFLNKAVDKTGDFFTGLFDKNGKPKKEKINNNNVNSSGDLTRGDIMGMAGTFLGGTAPMMNTMVNRMMTPKNQNFMREYGAEGLRAIQEAQGLATINRDKQLADIKLGEEAGRQRGRNSARGVNTLRAMDIASDMGANQAQNQAYNSYGNQMMQLLGQKAQMENQQDQIVMSGETARDLADRQDLDNYYTQLGTDLTTQSEALQQGGKNLNVSHGNRQIMALLPHLSRYGIGLKEDGKGGFTFYDVKTGTVVDENQIAEIVQKPEEIKTIPTPNKALGGVVKKSNKIATRFNHIMNYK